MAGNVAAPDVVPIQVVVEGCFWKRLGLKLHVDFWSQVTLEVYNFSQKPTQLIRPGPKSAVGQEHVFFHSVGRLS